MTDWYIHTTSTRGAIGWTRFTGTREEAEAKAKTYIGKVASYNMVNGWPDGIPNTDDVYITAVVKPDP